MTPVSPAAHRALTYYRWTTEDGETYTKPGLGRITVGAQGTGGMAHTGSRIVTYISWTHIRPDGESVTGRGVQELEYHIMRENMRTEGP